MTTRSRVVRPRLRLQDQLANAINGMTAGDEHIQKTASLAKEGGSGCIASPCWQPGNQFVCSGPIAGIELCRHRGTSLALDFIKGASV